jgi:Tol biopolymer transport system component
VVFASNADNLVSNDTNATTDIFRRNLETDKTQLVSRKSDQVIDGVRKPGAQAKGRSYLAAVSADGQKIVFVSEASNLGAQDANGKQPDVFFRNMKTGKTLTLSVTGQGEPTGNGPSGGIMGGGYIGGIAISGDGRIAAFGSGATDLSDNDENGIYGDIFAVLNLDSTIQNTLQPHLVSSTKGVQGNFDSFTPALDYEGETLAYWSTSNNLIANDTNNASDIFVQDLFGQNVERANVTNIGGEQDTGGARDVTIAINDAGNRVVFSSWGMLQEGTCAQQPQVYMRDTSAQTTQRVSVAYNGNCGDHWADYPDISADGKYVTFTSAATDLVPGDTNTFDDVFLRGML